MSNGVNFRELALDLRRQLTEAQAELAAIKAQEPVEYQLRALIRDVTNIPEAGYYMPQSWHGQVIALSLSGKLDAPVSEAKAQGVVMPDVNAAAKALCNRHAMICGVDADDQWKEYSQDFIADAETVLANARLNAVPAAPAADAGLVLEQAMYALIGIGYHENSGLVHELRQALAAYRAKGVV